MALEKYTDRAKGFLQSAQTMALRRGHQRLTPEHLLKVLLEDGEELCANLIRAAGGDPKAAPELARVFEQAEQWRTAPATAL
jgi:ATP-dependent Clp protease ATP-binding subunit ClpB